MPTVTLQKMPMPNWRLSPEERGEIFDRGERVILVDGVRWGRTHVQSMGSRGNRTTFSQDGSGQTILRELRPGKFADEYVDSTSKKEAKRWIDGKYQLPPDFKPTEQLVLERAQKLVDDGRLRAPEIVRAEVAERRRLMEKSRRDAQAEENKRFRAKACEVLRIRFDDEHLLPEREADIQRVIEAMRWAQDQ